MAPKKRSIAKNKTNSEKPSKKSKTDTKSDTNGLINEVLNKESNGLRRSKRVSITAKNTIQTKSRFFNDSEDNGIESDVSDGEEFKPKLKKVKQSIVRTKKSIEVQKCESSSSEEEEWEEVKNNTDEEELNDYNPDIPSEGVQITLNECSVKKKRCLDFNDLIRQKINRFKRDLQSTKHKTSLVLLISRAFYLNNSVNDELIQAISLSLTLNAFKVPKRLTLNFLNQFIDWFKDNFNLKYSKNRTNEPIIESLIRCLEKRVAGNTTEFNLTFLSLFRSLNKKFNSRLCYALNPVDIKPKDLILSEKQMEAKKNSKNSNKKSSTKRINNENKQKSSKRKIVSSDSEEENETFNDKLVDIWIEIYVESDRKWLSLDLSNDILDKPLDIASHSLSQISYVIALDSEGYIREITQRYATDWMSNTMKNRRTDQIWWTQTLKAFERKTKSAPEKSEDNEFEEKMSSTPLPTKISEYKNHPLYVLKKDLLKFQGIYPSDAPPLGFIRGEPVFARECVHLLRSRETWLRFARTVRIGETAYKLVKSRPKWDKYSKIWRKDLPLELFGEWQTEPYDPPEAKDGKVPRNGYGNIDLFQPCMLPKGCVHLQLPGLLRIANKLKIDCAPAIVAFDNNNGGLGSHPVMDGYIVCEEFEEVLTAAWDEEQLNAKQREKEKREKRVYENWRKLIKGLLIREKVKKKYNNCEKDCDNDDTEVESDS